MELLCPEHANSILARLHTANATINKRCGLIIHVQMRATQMRATAARAVLVKK
jgi:hypothetical protein